MKPTDLIPETSESPLRYAVVGFFCVPLIAAVVILFAGLLLLAWPLVPFWLYREKKRNPHAPSKYDPIGVYYRNLRRERVRRRR